MSPFTPLNADSAAFDDQVDVKAESEASTLVKVEGSGSGGEEAVDDGLTTGNNMTADGHVGDGDGKKPVTPKERTRAAAKKNAAEDAAGENDEGTTKKKVKTPTKASPGEKTAESGGLRIPKSLEAASDADKMLLRMRDVEGKSWAVITKAWVAATGEEVMNVKGRYYKMKANFTEFKRGDVELLLKIKKDVETKFETEKWGKIQEGMKNGGGGSYPIPALQKKWREVAKNPSVATDGGVDES